MRIRILGLALLLSGLSLAAGAQPGPTYVPCLDTWTINSGSIFIARIAEVCSPSRCGADNVVALNVERSLKGDEGPKPKLALDASPSVLKDWKRRKASLLIFDGVNQEPLSATRALAEPLDLSDPQLTILTADLQVLRGADPILEATSKAIQTHPGVQHVPTFQRFLLDESRGLDANLPPITLVPIDSDLESWARSTLLGPPHPAIDLALRPEAVNALQYFPAPENIALLRSLLDDPASTVQPAEFNLGVEVRTYPVRLEAYTVLKGWKVNVPEPVTREQNSKPDSVTFASLSNRIGMIGQEEIKDLGRFAHLEQLELRNDHLTAQAYKALRTLGGVKTIVLSGSNITDGKLPHLAELNHLEALDLSGTRITDTGLQTIAALPELKSLNLTQSKVTAKAVRQLRSERPDLMIEYR